MRINVIFSFSVDGSIYPFGLLSLHGNFIQVNVDCGLGDWDICRMCGYLRNGNTDDADDIISSECGKIISQDGF